ncbi:hypothetical protein ACOSQ2_022988 [Xanthoceras sorbifolium]
METPETSEICSTSRIELGLKALTICSENDHNHDQKHHHHNSCLMTSNPFPPPISAPSYSHISDYIGTESCGDLNHLTNNIDLRSSDHDHDHHQSHESYDHQRLKTKKMKNNNNNKEYPPPMTSLPFVLKRNSTSDGRLILTKEKVKRREFLKAHRSNGRLTLELVSIDHDDDHETAVHVEETVPSKYYSEGIGGNFSSTVMIRSASC